MTTRPTAQLIAEHEHILQLCQVLDRLATLAEDDPAPPLEDMATAIGLVQRYADALHHGKEEALLFPRLEGRGMPRQGGPIGCMLHEHEQGRAALAAMEDGLDALRAGGSGVDFAEAALGYTALLRDHIHKENEVLFPMAEELLGPEDKAELLAAFARVEQHDLGPVELERLRTQLAELVEAHQRPAST